MSKIISINEIKKKKLNNKKVILCHGVFDLLHIGHLRYFKEAKNLGDILVVSVTSDEFVNKGPGKPRFDINTRMEALENIKTIDYIIRSDFSTAEKIIKILKPSFYVKGKDYKKNTNDISKNIFKEIKAAKLSKTKVYYTKSAIYSSSKLINDSELNPLNEKQRNKIKDLKTFLKKKSFEEILVKLKKLNVLVIGETILDRYVFCETIGKSGKEPMLVLKEKRTKDYVGGAASIALQISKFVRNTTLISSLGEKKEHKNFFFKKLEKINKKYIYKKSSPTIVKKRYVDDASNSKTLGVYSINDDRLNISDENKLKSIIKKNISKNDIIIISDYGHGLISNRLSDFISKSSKRIFVNCQVNANNKGWHSILKYKGCFCVFINETELRYEVRDQHSTIHEVIKKFTKLKNKFNYILVTKGNEGVLFYDLRKNFFYDYPAFGNKISDKVGAGDSMLSIFSIFFTVTNSLELSLFLSSIAAAKTLKDFGNEHILEKKDYLKILKHL